MATNVFDLREFRADDVAAAGGTAFGSSGAMLQPAARQRERRQAFADLLAGLTRAMDRRNDISLMRGAFEDLMRRAVPVRTIQLREAGSRWIGRPEAVWRRIVRRRSAWRRSGQCRRARGDIRSLVPASGSGTFRCSAWPRTSARWSWKSSGPGCSWRAPGCGRRRAVRRDGAAPLIGSTPIMAALRGSIERVSVTDFTVLLEGESGVGKELVARQIHELSRRRNGPFVAINCAALVETLLEAELFGIEDRTATGVRGRRGKFEAADGGTLFLDEVSDLSLSAQAKLLRAIQDLAVERVGGHGTHRVDIRIVAATNREPRGAGRACGSFRPDLFYRLSGVDVRVPTLRERRPDVLELAQYFLATASRHTSRCGCRPWRHEALVTYDWPGNVRELERLIERAVALTESDVIELDDLPPKVRGDYADGPRAVVASGRHAARRGRAATRGWCSIAAAATNARRAACSASATTRCRRISGIRRPIRRGATATRRWPSTRQTRRVSTPRSRRSERRRRVWRRAEPGVSGDSANEAGQHKAARSRVTPLTERRGR